MRFGKSMWTFLALASFAVSHPVARGQFPADFQFGDELTGTDFTLAGWFRASGAQLTDAAVISNKNWDSGGNVGYVLTAQAGGGGTGHQWKVNANGLGGTRSDTDWTDYNLNQWVYITATFDRDGDLIAYTNGGDLSGGSTSVRATPQGLIDTYAAPVFYDLNIGQDGTGNYAGGQGFIGQVEDFAVWRRALDATEVSELYNRAINSSQSLGSLFGTSLNGGTNIIDQSLVGYYSFDGNLNDGAGSAQNGIARVSGGGAGTVSFSSGLFGQAADLTGSNYITIGDSVPPNDASFTGNSPANNLASNPANWDLNPASLTDSQGIIVATGTSAVFTGANTGPAVFDGTFTMNPLKNFRFGGASQTTYLNFVNSAGGGANIIGVGADSIIGTAGSNVTLTMSGNGRLEHRGAGEEEQEMIIGQQGATVNITMSGTTEIASGPKVADPAYATGYRRPVSTDPPGTPPRSGDDIKIGDGNDGANAVVNLTMNESSTVFVSDILYPGDSNNSHINVVQNDSSRVIANWDVFALDDGHDAGEGVDWTMNDNSKFLVARDSVMGSTVGNGTMNLTINDNAEFYTGDRIVLGTAGGNINVTLNSGLIKVGGDSPSDLILVDGTGEVPPGSEPIAIDWILHMGGGANAKLQVNGGRVEVGRSAYIGRGGGNAHAIVNGGVFEVKGQGPIGLGLGSGPGGGVPSDVDWFSNGGDVVVGNDQGDTAVFEFRRGSVSVAHDFIVSLDSDFSGVGGEGTLRMVTGPAGSSFGVGNDLSFGGDLFGASGGEAHLEVVFRGPALTPIVANGGLHIYNNGTTVSDFSLSVPVGGLPPTVGQYLLLDYAGARTGDLFTELPATGVTYDLIYDDVNSRVMLSILSVTLNDGDFNNDGQFNCTDVDALVANIVGGTNPPAFDLTSDGLVNTVDLTAWLGQAGAKNLASGNPYLPGDANLNGSVDGSDFGIWNGNKFTNVPAWCSGDFNASGAVDGSDFNLWNANKFLSADSVAAVPEPTGAAVLVGILVGLSCRPGRRRGRCE